MDKVEPDPLEQLAHTGGPISGSFLLRFSHIHRPPEGRAVRVRRDDADQVSGEDVGLEQDRAGDCPREPSAERGFADVGSPGDDQEGRSDEGALVSAMRAPVPVATSASSNLNGT